MKLSPLELRKHQFSKKFRFSGYDAAEVNGFMRQMADQWSDVLEENRRHEARVDEMQTKLKHYEQVELALQEALETARQTARQLEDNADRKARLMVEEAELRATQMVSQAEQDRYSIRQDLVKLNSRQGEIAARMRAFLMAEMEVLAQFQGDDPIGFIRLVSAEDSGAAGMLPGSPAQLSEGDAVESEAEDKDVADAATHVDEADASSAATDAAAVEPEAEPISAEGDLPPVATEPEPISAGLEPVLPPNVIEPEPLVPESEPAPFEAPTIEPEPAAETFTIDEPVIPPIPEPAIAAKESVLDEPDTETFTIDESVISPVPEPLITKDEPVLDDLPPVFQPPMASEPDEPEEVEIVEPARFAMPEPAPEADSFSPPESAPIMPPPPPVFEVPPPPPPAEAGPPFEVPDFAPILEPEPVSSLKSIPEPSPLETVVPPPPPPFSNDVNIEESTGRPTYRDMLSGTSGGSTPLDEMTNGPSDSEAAAPGKSSYASSFFTGEPSGASEDASSSGSEQKWSLRSLVTGDGEEEQKRSSASEAERERIRRILEDLD